MDYFDNIISFFNISPAVYLSYVLFTVGAFNWMRTLANSYRAHSEWIYVIIIIINGLLPTVFNAIISTTLASDSLAYVNPVFLMIFMPLIITLEFACISRDNLKIYVFHFCNIMLHLACIFGLSAAIITTMAEYTDRDLSDSSVVLATITLMMALMSISLDVQSFTMRKLSSQLRSILTSQSAGSTLFIYVAINGIVLGLLSGVDYLVYFTPDDVNGIRDHVLLATVFRYLLILVTGMIIIYTRCKVEAEKEQASVLQANLDLENKKSYVKNDNVIFEYEANINKNQVIKGMEYLSDSLINEGGGSYSKLVSIVLENIIHPEDRYVLQSLVDGDEKNEDDIDGKSIKVKFRYNTKKILDSLIFKEKEINIIKSLGKLYAWGELSILYLVDDRTKDVIVYVNLKDINASEEEKAELEIAATLDQLTGVYNRATITDKIAQTLEKQRSMGTPDGAFLIIDLDFFKEINDNFGHPEGDKVLKKVAMILRNSFRGDDLVGRLGGDEFCVFMSSGVNDDIIKNKAKLINDKIHFEYKTNAGVPIYLTASIGVAPNTDINNTYKSLYEAADKALYIAKEGGKNRTHIA